MNEFEIRLAGARTESEMLTVLIETLMDADMNEIGGFFYNGQGQELGETATIRLRELKRPRPLDERFAAVPFAAILSLTRCQKTMNKVSIVTQTCEHCGHGPCRVVV